MNPQKLRLETQYYRTIPISQMAYETQVVELDPARTALVVLHCWDIGCEGGPAIDPNYYVGMGTLESFQEADRIMRDLIRPATDAAREAEILVCHVEHPDIARKYPQSRQAEDPPVPTETGPVYAPAPVIEGLVEEMVTRTHGKEYATRSPYAQMSRAALLEPQPHEPVVHQTNQFDRILRKHGIENLVYSGFAADMCILRAPAATEAMSQFGYRLFLLRDATVGIEFPDFFEHRVSTRWAVRYFESRHGNTLFTAEFIRACKNLARSRSGTQT
jgi:nicotinamidase-related amidase